MARDVVSAKLDIIFKKFFIENPDMLHSFVASMLDIPYENISEINITNPEMPPSMLTGKHSYLDLNMKVDDRLVNVEIQVQNDPDYRDRVLFYWAKLYTSELKSGEPYGGLKQAICISIVNFNIFDGKDYHNEVNAVVKRTGEVFSDKLNIHFFELKKVNKTPNPQNSCELWLQFINADSEEDFEMINQTNIPIMQKAVRVIYDMSEDTRIREEARMREKALHDEASALYNAKKEGLAEGEAKGLAKGLVEGEANGLVKGRSEIIEKMRAFGMTDEQIQAILGK